MALRQHTFSELVTKIYEEESQQKCWDFFLHHVRDKSFKQFMDEMKKSTAPVPTMPKASVQGFIESNVAKFEKMRFGSVPSEEV